MAEQILPIKVYLEDTDAQGIVYHANYLKYFERARTELLENAGFHLRKLQEEGWTFVVYEMRIKFHKPAKLQDHLEIRTTAERTSPFRVLFDQRAVRAEDGERLCGAEVVVVAVTNSGELREIPPELVGQ